MTNSMYRGKEDSYNEAQLDSKGRVVRILNKAPEGDYLTVVKHGLFSKKSKTYFSPTKQR
jgi:hypothetical protein